MLPILPRVMFGSDDDEGEAAPPNCVSYCCARAGNEAPAGSAGGKPKPSAPSPSKSTESRSRSFAGSGNVGMTTAVFEGGALLQYYYPMQLLVDEFISEKFVENVRCIGLAVRCL